MGEGLRDVQIIFYSLIVALLVLSSLVTHFSESVLLNSPV